MPTIFRKNGFRFFFYSGEAKEPPHIHVIGRGGEMKIWLDPLVISKSYNLKVVDQREVLSITEENVKMFLNAWRNLNG